jgi:4a-hydroxytetrahydrobiopterin dehydratase
MGEKLSIQQVLDAGLDDWRWVLDGLRTRFRTGDFVTGLALAQRIGEAAEEAGHHPDLDLRYPHLDVRLVSHDVQGVTGRDVDLARRVSALAAELGVRADPSATTVLEMGLDTSDPASIRLFWKALLGLEDHPDDESLVDPSGSTPGLWFQDTEPHEPPRQRFHYDVWVPHDVAEQRVQAALEAGGTLVSDADAPSFWVLADSQGNRACVCTALDRGW